MQLNEHQINRYRTDGFLVLESLFSMTEVEDLRAGYESDAANPAPHRFLEPDSDQVATLFALHDRLPEFAALARSPRLLEPARQLVAEQLYLYQMKVNTKSAFGGKTQGWHQDYIAWRLADQLSAPRMVTMGLLLDDSTEFNAPLIFIPGSHTTGLLRDDRAAGSEPDDFVDSNDVSLSPEILAELVERHGMRSVRAPAGSVVIFHPEVVHGSAPNM
ncbi:phytanoyl-CoA dioxygenase family protein [Nocardia crassostreae]|uniref:phytanoyl-CoA dioxygenase family protein n=1 Tax=Nocardia crassostreae TaxID=53428 RepID=UPI000B2568F4|nr:phytanoyl-CoA dioxygenase family protein [Nocardia crassostreae]